MSAHIVHTLIHTCIYTFDPFSLSAVFSWSKQVKKTVHLKIGTVDGFLSPPFLNSRAVGMRIKRKAHLEAEKTSEENLPQLKI